MDTLMQALFGHLMENQLALYCARTALAERERARDEVGRRLWEQLEGEQRALLEELQRAYDYAQMAELEAMYLAAFDQCAALHRPHTA